MNPNCMHHAKYKPFGQMCKMRYLQFKVDENNAEINTELQLLHAYVKTKT